MLDRIQWPLYDCVCLPSRVVRKSIARVLTVINQTQKENLRKFYKVSRRKPYDFHLGKNKHLFNSGYPLIEKLQSHDLPMSRMHTDTKLFFSTNYRLLTSQKINFSYLLKFFFLPPPWSHWFLHPAQKITARHCKTMIANWNCQCILWVILVVGWGHHGMYMFVWCVPWVGTQLNWTPLAQGKCKSQVVLMLKDWIFGRLVYKPFIWQPAQWWLTIPIVWDKEQVAKSTRSMISGFS